MDNQTEVSIKFRNSVTNLKRVQEYAEQLSIIKSVLSGIDTGKAKELDNSAKSTNEINDDVKDMAKKIKIAFNIGAIKGFTRALQRTFTIMSNLATKSSDYLENINLFQVAFDNNYASAEKFVNKLTEMYGLDESWLIKTVGIFKQLSNAMNLSTEQGTKLSTLLTQMSLDISSLYNIDISRASSVLQSAMAGQTRPIRSATGADITQATLQQTLNELDIDRPITQLSYAEKRLITIVSLTKQLTEATNDFGRTIESPSNQMRILNEQWVRLSRAVGNLFMPIIAKVLPYLNAILMVLTEIINTVAILLGFNVDDYDYFSGIADSVLDLEDGLEGASESAKKLKQGLRGFDKLNVITTPSSATATTGGTGTIDPKIWEAFNDAFDEYNSKLENIQMKATKIRDAIMEWLGFTKQIDIETGKVSFKFDHITSGTIISALFVGGALVSGLAKIVSFIQSISKVLGASKLPTVLETLKNILPLLGKVVVVLTSLVGIFNGSKGIYNIMKKVNRETEKGSKTYKDYKKNIGIVTLSATALGTVLGGPLGAVIGLITGLTLSGIVAFEGYKTSVESIAKSNIFGELTISLEEWNEILTNNGTQIENYGGKLTTLQESLGNMNTSFQASTEELDLYGYKFGLLGQKISEEDSVKIINALQNMADQSISIIQESTDFSLQLWGDTFKNATTITEEEQKNMLNAILNYGNDQQREIKTAQENITKTYDEAIKTRGYLTDEEYEYIQKQLEKIRQLTNKEMKKSQSEIEYLKLQFADENYKLDEESYKNFQIALDNYIKDQQDSIKENYRIRLEDAQYYYDNHIWSEEQFNDALKEAYEIRIQEEKALKEEIDDIQEKVYKSLDERYSEIIDKTSEVAQKERSIIENIFSNINLNDADLQKKFKNAGIIARKNFEKGLGTNVQVGGNIIVGFNTTGMYADGGLPPVGQLFVANEKGAELVGHIGGQSFVANQNQMMDLLDRKLGQAGNTGTQVFNIYLDENHKLGTYTLDQLKDMAKSNGKPITIS